jgi:hypothetical protein
MTGRGNPSCGHDPTIQSVRVLIPSLASACVCLRQSSRRLAHLSCACWLAPLPLFSCWAPCDVELNELALAIGARPEREPQRHLLESASPRQRRGASAAREANVRRDSYTRAQQRPRVLSEPGRRQLLRLVVTARAFRRTLPHVETQQPRVGSRNTRRQSINRSASAAGSRCLKLEPLHQASSQSDRCQSTRQRRSRQGRRAGQRPHLAAAQP